MEEKKKVETFQDRLEKIPRHIRDDMIVCWCTDCKKFVFQNWGRTQQHCCSECESFEVNRSCSYCGKTFYNKNVGEDNDEGICIECVPRIKEDEKKKFVWLCLVPTVFIVLINVLLSILFTLFFICMK